MSYDGPSLSEWLAELRARRPMSEVVLYRAELPEPLVSAVSGASVTSVRIVRYEDPDNPRPDRGIYVISLSDAGEEVADTWHEDLEDAFAQAESELGLRRVDWAGVDSTG